MQHLPAAPGGALAPPSVPSGTPFNVSWSAVSGATSYDLRQTKEGQTGGVIYHGASTHYTAQLLGNHDRYRFAARACNSAGCSGWTQASHWTEVFPPGGPIGIDPPPP